MRQRRIFSLLMCLGSCIAVSAQTLPLDSCIRKGKLANGLTYYIRHNAQTPGQADFYIAQRVGSILEKPEQRGLAHFLEHMHSTAHATSPTAMAANAPYVTGVNATA